MKFAVFSVSMPDYTPIEALDKLKEFGYDGVEWRCTTDKGDMAKPGFWSGNRTTMSAQTILERADELKSQCAKRGLEMPSLGAYADCMDLANVELHLRATAAIGAKNVRIGSGHYKIDGDSYARQFAHAKAQYAKVAELARKHKVRAVIETHMGLLTPSVASIRALLDGLDPKDVGIMWDPANQVTEGSEIYPMALDIAGEYLAEIHAKNARHVIAGHDNNYTQWKLEQAPVREGEVDWPAVINLLKKKNYNGWIVFEDFSTTLPLDQRLKGNIDWFKALVK